MGQGGAPRRRRLGSGSASLPRPPAVLAPGCVGGCGVGCEWVAVDELQCHYGTPANVWRRWHVLVIRCHPTDHLPTATAAAGIAQYEKVFGAGFVSPGGLETHKEYCRLLNPQPGEQVLDVGCGLCGGAHYMARTFGCYVYGVDLSGEWARAVGAVQGAGIQVIFCGTMALMLSLTPCTCPIPCRLHCTAPFSNRRTSPLLPRSQHDPDGAGARRGRGQRRPRVVRGVGRVVGAAGAARRLIRRRHLT